MLACDDARERVPDHADRDVGDAALLQLAGGRPRDLRGVRRARERTAAWMADEVDQHVVELRAAVRVLPNPIEDLDDRADDDVEPRFLAHFATDRGFERLTHFDRPARDAPL